MLRLAWDISLRVVVAGAFFAGAVAAFGAALVEQRSDAASAWALALERGEHVSAVALGDVLPAEQGRLDCRSRSLKTALTVSLAALEASNPARDYSDWAQSLLGANAVALRAVQCAPTDGNAWLRLAMVERAAAEFPERLQQLVSLSGRLSPQELDIVAARLAFQASLSPPTRARLVDDAKRDVAALAP